MLCSKCSGIVRPVVAIDIDGTLGDYHAHFIEFAIKYLGHKPNALAQTMLPSAISLGDGSFKQWFINVFDSDERTWHDIKLAYRQGAQKRSMPVFDDAKMLVDKVSEAGAEVWITTTRPYLRLDGIDPDTRYWLDKHGINFHGLLYDQDKYLLLDERVETGRVVAVLDDLPEQYDAAEKLFGESVPILAGNRYNFTISRANEAPNLKIASGMILDRIDSWKSWHSVQNDEL